MHQIGAQQDGHIRVDEFLAIKVLEELLSKYIHLIIFFLHVYFQFHD